MKLREYLDHYGMRYNVFARRIGVSTPTMSKILSPGYNPACDFIHKIEKITRKEVTYKDWIDGILEKQAKNID